MTGCRDDADDDDMSGLDGLEAVAPERGIGLAPAPTPRGLDPGPTRPRLPNTALLLPGQRDHRGIFGFRIAFVRRVRVRACVRA